MPIKEATFWFGITVFGTGLFLCLDAEGTKLIWAIVLIVVGLLAAAYAVVQYHYPHKIPKAPLWIGLLALTWASVGYYLYVLHDQLIPEFDAPITQMLQGYGTDGPNSCAMVVSGKVLLSLSKGYKLAVGCFIYDGSVYVLDAPGLQVGNLYDITADQTRLMAKWGDSFNRYRVEKGATGLNIALLIVPNGVQPSQFTTLRQARALGVKIPRIVTATSMVRLANPGVPN